MGGFMIWIKIILKSLRVQLIFKILTKLNTCKFFPRRRKRILKRLSKENIQRAEISEELMAGALCIYLRKHKSHEDIKFPSRKHYMRYVLKFPNRKWRVCVKNAHYTAARLCGVAASLYFSVNFKRFTSFLFLPRWSHIKYPFILRLMPCLIVSNQRRKKSLGDESNKIYWWYFYWEIFVCTNDQLGMTAWFNWFLLLGEGKSY